MNPRRNRYKEMERSTSFVLFADLILFIFFLIAAANGILWLRVVLFILTLILSLLCLLLLYYNGELTKRRSLWMSAGFASIAACVLIAFILNYPSPNPYTNQSPTTSETVTETDDTKETTSPATT